MGFVKQDYLGKIGDLYPANSGVEKQREFAPSADTMDRLFRSLFIEPLKYAVRLCVIVLIAAAATFNWISWPTTPASAQKNKSESSFQAREDAYRANNLG